MPKRSRERRAHLKRYASDYINTNSGPRALVTDATKPGEILGSPKSLTAREAYQNTNVDQWFNNQDRVKTTTGPKHDKTPILNNTFTKELPPSKDAMPQVLYVHWQGDRNQGFETYVCVAVLHKNLTTGWKRCLYRSANTYFIQEEDQKTIKRSIFYTREKAMRADEQSRIIWIQVLNKS